MKQQWGKWNTKIKVPKAKLQTKAKPWHLDPKISTHQNSPGLSQIYFPIAAAAKSRQLSIVSDSVRPHRRQPTRLLRPWDSPAKNTGVGCHFLLQCMKVKRENEVPQSSPTPHDPTDYSPPGSSIHASSQARVLEWAAIAFSNFPIGPWLLVDAQTRSQFLSLLDTCHWNDLNHIIKGLVPFSPIPLLGIQNGILQLGLNKIG